MCWCVNVRKRERERARNGLWFITVSSSYIIFCSPRNLRRRTGEGPPRNCDFLSAPSDPLLLLLCIRIFRPRTHRDRNKFRKRRRIDSYNSVQGTPCLGCTSSKLPPSPYPVVTTLRRTQTNSNNIIILLSIPIRYNIIIIWCYIILCSPKKLYWRFQKWINSLTLPMCINSWIGYINKSHIAIILNSIYYHIIFRVISTRE